MRRFTLPLLAILFVSAMLSMATQAAPPEVVKAASVLPVPDSSQIWTAIESLEQRVDRLEKQTTAATPVIISAAPAVSYSYTARWHNNSGMSDRDHAINEHGFDPNLSDAELARQHDAYNDRYGPASPRFAPAMRSRTVTVQSPYVSSCPGGVCPTSRSVSVQSSGGVFGFGVFGRRR